MSDLVMVPLPEESDSPSYSVNVEVEAANRAEDVRNQLRALKKAVDRSFLRMGAYMQEMRDKKHYRQLGYLSLEDFCLKELDYGARQVRTFVRVYETFVQKLAIDETRLLEVGSTKLAELSAVITASNAEELLRYAGENNVPTVSNRVALMLGHDGVSHEREEHGKPFFWHVPLTPPEADFINATIELAKLSNGSESVGGALMAICADFQSGLGADANRPTLTCFLTREEKEIISIGREEAREQGFLTIGPFLAHAVRCWRTMQASTSATLDNDARDF